MKRLLFAFLMGAVLTIATAVAQDVQTGGGDYYNYTPRGAGGIINAQGQRNLSNSQAAINLTDARSSQIQNQVSSVNAYWEKKGIYSQHEQEKLSEQDAERQKQIARHGLQPLTPQQFNRTTGQVNWPGQFKVQPYESYRTTIDAEFLKRAQGGMLTGDDYLAATTALNNWHAAIVKDKDKYPSAIVDQMLRFLLSLKHELDDNLG